VERLARREIGIVRAEGEVVSVHDEQIAAGQEAPAQARLQPEALIFR
jgi:hypothetical protein